MEVMFISYILVHLVFNNAFLSSAEWEKEKEQEYEERQKRKEKREKVGDILNSITNKIITVLKIAEHR